MSWRIGLLRSRHTLAYTFLLALDYTGPEEFDIMSPYSK